MNVQNTQYIHKTFIQINFHKRDSKSNTNVHTWYPIANWAQDAEDLSIIELNVKKIIPHLLNKWADVLFLPILTLW